MRELERFLRELERFLRGVFAALLCIVKTTALACSGESRLMFLSESEEAFFLSCGTIRVIVVMATWTEMSDTTRGSTTH